MKVTGPIADRSTQTETGVLDGATLAQSAVPELDPKMADLIAKALARGVTMPHQTVVTELGGRDLVITGVKVIGTSNRGGVDVEIGDLHTLEGAK